MTDDEISPERFRDAREHAGAAGERLDVVDLAKQIEGAIENDAPRTVQGAKALGFVGELRDRLEADR